MTWGLIVSKSAQKDLKRLPARDRARVGRAIDGLAEDPFAGDLKQLQAGAIGYRRRVGDYRIFFRVDPKAEAVYVTSIERRTSTTY